MNSSFLKRFYATVNIRDLNRVKFLRCLWENAQPASFYKCNDKTPPMIFCKKTARHALRQGYRIDYHQGRAIKMSMHLIRLKTQHTSSIGVKMRFKEHWKRQKNKDFCYLRKKVIIPR